MKPRVTVLVGAGASLDVGIPSTSDLLGVSFDALRECCGRRETDNATVIAAALRERCLEYFGENFNFEQLMHVLEAIDSLRQGLLAKYPTTSLPIEALLSETPHPKIASALGSLFAFAAPRALIGALHQCISVASRGVSNSKNWYNYVGFWRSLADNFDLNIGTLNYDSALEQALDLGPQDQGFAPIPEENVWRLDEILLRDVPRLMHMHGSIHLGRRELASEPNRFCYEDDWHDWYWHPTPESAATALSPGVSAAQTGFRGYPKGPLITGHDKAEKLLMDPFGSYLRVFTDCLRSTNRLLVVGYGFGDHHINAVLRKMGRYHSDGLRVAVVTKFDPVEMHGSWDQKRANEALMYTRWGKDERLLDAMKYEDPLRAKSGLLRVYYDGVLNTRLRHTEDLLAFLAS